MDIFRTQARWLERELKRERERKARWQVMEKEFGSGGIFLNPVVFRDAQKFELQDKSKRGGS